MDTTTMTCPENYTLRIACDDSCVLVQKLAAIIRWWDKGKKLTFVERDSLSEDSLKLYNQLDASPWSLIIFDDQNDRFEGPEAIPMILKNLPSGKIFAVLYTLPGTMWSTRQLYTLVSRSKSRFAQQQQHA